MPVPTDQLARNPVLQYTRLLGFSINAQNILSPQPAAPKAETGTLWSQGGGTKIEAGAGVALQCHGPDQRRMSHVLVRSAAGSL
jgi:hypothetical protein